MRIFAIAALALPAAAAADEIAIRHSAAACVPADRYARLVAAGAPADRVASAEAQFRGGSEGDWYAARMARGEDGAWSAYLPRPRRGTGRIEYRIVMTDAGARSSSTAVHALAVDPACAVGETAVEVPSPIVVRVPEGAPVVPPVPPAFSPAGVVAAETGRLSTTTKWIAAAGLAATAGAGVAALGAKPAPVAPGPLQFSFVGILPNPGSTMSLGRGDTFTVSVRLVGGTREPFTFIWDWELLAEGTGVRCAAMRGVGEITLARPEVVLTSPIMRTAECGTSFDVGSARLLIVARDAVVYDQVHALPYRIRP
jgi:hypothetical protein